MKDFFLFNFLFMFLEFIFFDLSFLWGSFKLRDFHLLLHLFFPSPYKGFGVICQFLIDPDFPLLCTYSINKQSHVKKKFFRSVPEAYFPAESLLVLVSVMNFPKHPVAVLCFPLAVALALQEKKVSWETPSNYFNFYYFLSLQAGRAFPSFFSDFALI